MPFRSTSRHRDALPGVSLDHFSRIPNHLISDLLLSLGKPWPDEAVHLYLHSLVSFGRRSFTVELRKDDRIAVQLDAGEFICPMRKLAKMSGRGRTSLQAVIRQIAEEVRRTNRGSLPVYRLKGSDDDGLGGEVQDRMNTSAIAPKTAVINSPSGPPAPASGPPNGLFRDQVDSAVISSKTAVINTPFRTTSTPNSGPHKRENNKREKIKREKGGNSKTDSGHAAHDLKERRGCGAVSIADILPSKKDTVSSATAVDKTQVLRRLAQFCTMISPDQLRMLMRRYGVTAEELEAARAGNDPVASPVSTKAAQ